MREASGPAMATMVPDAHLLQPVIDRARREPDRTVAAYRDGEQIIEVSAAGFEARVRQLARGLIASGVTAGDRVALMSHTRVEWMQLDYAILAAGAVTVPVYETSSAEQLGWIVGDSGSVIAVVETPDMGKLYESVTDGLPECREVLVIDEGALEELTRRGQEVDESVVDERIAGITTDQLATIVYTSGTTGRPKGCMLTHGNLRINVLQTLEGLRSMLQAEEVSLQFLPLAHTLAKIIALVGMEYGVRSFYTSDVSRLVEEMGAVQPTMVAAVPRVFEKVFNTAQQKAGNEGKGAIFNRAAAVAIRWSQQRQTGGPALQTTLTNMEHALFDRLVYGKLRAVFGGRLRLAFSGGGPLGDRLTHFFDGIGVKIFEGYGLTETSPVLSFNREGAWKPGTVGRPVAGTTIKVADDGEILARGPQVFQGYWHNEAATKETFDDEGWFKTGDIGEIDDRGFVRITGRKKELIVTAAGKNVAPAPLEDRLRAHPLISQAIVVGDSMPFIAALVALDEEAVRAWLSGRGREEKAVSDLVDDADLRAAVQAAVDDANKLVSRAESIRKFAILPRDLSIEAGELTPSMKVRRSTVEKAYRHAIDELYAG